MCARLWTGEVWAAARSGIPLVKAGYGGPGVMLEPKLPVIPESQHLSVVPQRQ